MGYKNDQTIIRSEAMRWKIMLFLGILAILAIIGFMIIRGSKAKDESVVGGNKIEHEAIDPNNLPKIVQADFIDLAKITSISKFRSGSGHDFSYRQKGEESCRSMKHYFNTQATKEIQNYKSSHNGLPPEYTADGAIPIYSPVDGKITRIEPENTPIGEQISIQPKAYPQFLFRIFHVYKDKGVQIGKEVKAGDQIGNIGQYQNTDIAVELAQEKGYSLVSYFDLMPENIFAKYLGRGIKDRNSLIITKEYRDANPLECNGEQFVKNYDELIKEENLVLLFGYQEVK